MIVVVADTSPIRYLVRIGQILVEAVQAGLVHIDPVLAKLKEANFRATQGLYERARQLALTPSPIPPWRKQE